MKIHFESVEFKNFLSFGNKISSIEFKSGFNLVSGANGSGKSSILLDAITYVLYGKPYRKIKKDQLINRTNKKHLMVRCTFYKDKDKFVIVRKMKPNSLEIIKNGKTLDLLSTSDLNQTEIDKIIGVDYTMFKQIVSTAVNYNRPFLSLYAHEKRALVESLFNLSILSEMHKLLKVDKVDNKMKLSNIETNLKSLNQIIQNLDKQIEETEHFITNFENIKNDQLKQLNNQINEVKEKIENKKIDVEELSNSINKIDCSENVLVSTIKEIEKSINDLFTDMGVLKGNLTQYMDDIEMLNNTDVCPRCKTRVNEDHKEKETIKIKEELQKKSNEYFEKEQKKNSIASDLEKAKDVLKQLKDLKSREEHLKKDIGYLEKQCNQLKNQYNEKENEQTNVSTDNLVQMYIENKTSMSEYIKEYSKESQMTKIHDIVEQMLSDSGVRSDFYTNIVPVLNNKVNEYLQSFELPILIKFDNNLEYTIRSVTTDSDDLNYNSFSEGEKKKADISLLLSFIFLAKMISNWECNLLIFDEILDGAVDSNGLETIIQSLKEIITRNSDIALYIISHRLSDTSFDNKLLVIKNNGFSEIKTI